MNDSQGRKLSSFGFEYLQFTGRVSVHSVSQTSFSVQVTESYFLKKKVVQAIFLEFIYEESLIFNIKSVHITTVHNDVKQFPNDDFLFCTIMNLEGIVVRNTGGVNGNMICSGVF